MNPAIYILIGLVIGFLIGRNVRYRIKNYGVSRIMYLRLERSEIDRRIQLAVDLEDYEVALRLKTRMDRMDRKIARIDKREKKNIDGITD